MVQKGLNYQILKEPESSFFLISLRSWEVLFDLNYKPLRSMDRHLNSDEKFLLTQAIIEVD